MPQFVTNGAFGYFADYLIWWFILLSWWAHTWCFFKCFPRKRYRKLALVVGNVLVFGAMGGCVAMVGETYLRFFSVETDAFGITKPAARWFRLYVDLNDWDCRDRAWDDPADRNATRIAFFGDSFLYGWGVRDPANRLTERIETALNRAPASARAALPGGGVGPVRVMNVAKPGWNTGDELAALESLMQSFRLSEVVLVYVPNDIEDLLPRRADFDPTRPPRNLFFNTDSSFLIEYFYYRIYLPYFPTVRGFDDWLADGYADPDIWNRQTQRFDALIRLCGDHGARLRVVLFPFLRTAGRRFDTEAIQAKVARFFRERGVDVLDLGPVFKGQDPAELVVNAHDAHPNPRAHGLAAEAILKAFYTGAGRARDGALRSEPRPSGSAPPSEPHPPGSG